MSQEIEKIISDLNKRHFPIVRRILNQYCYLFTQFREATFNEDVNEGFDAVFTTPESKKIPIRIRKVAYSKYMDFTVRSRSKYGMETEIHKIKKGFGDFYFYAWEGERCSIEKFMILDLDIFRSTVIDKPDDKRKNNDGTEFNTYSLRSLVINNVVKVYQSI